MTTPSYGYQWNRSGAAIPGATSSSYTVESADVGATLTCTVTASNSAGSVPATSAATSAVQAGTLALPLLLGQYGLTSAQMSSILGISHSPLTATYLDDTQAWSAGMWSSYYIDSASTAGKVVMSVPILIGPATGPSQTNSGTGMTTSPQNPSNTNTPTTMTLAQVAAGTWDSMFGPAFKTIAAARPDCIIRIGWEMYGNAGFWPWSGPANGANHKAAYIHLVELARTYSSQFTFDWCGGLDYNGYNPMTNNYPGNAYVDYISADIYDYFGLTPWATAVSAMTQALDLAKANGKLFSIGEIGPWPTSSSGGQGDDPTWFTDALAWLQANVDYIGYVVFFNGTAPPINNVIAEFPNMAAVIKSKYGPVYQAANADGE